MALDKEYGGPEFDLLSNEGFCNALYYTACLEPGSSKMAAPVCSTFVFMNLASKFSTVFARLMKYQPAFQLLDPMFPASC